MDSTEDSVKSNSINKVKWLMDRLTYPHCCLNCRKYLKQNCRNIEVINKFLEKARYKRYQVPPYDVGSACGDWK